MSDPINQDQDERCGRLIDIPEGLGRFVALRMAYVAICNGNACAAAILADFEYKTSCREADDAGEVWIYRSQADLQADFFGVFKLTNDIKPALKLLVELGYLHKRPSTRSPMDKTLEYRLDVDAIQAAVYHWTADYTREDSTPVREVVGDLSRSRRQLMDETRATEGRSDAANGETRATDALATGDRVLESLNTESAQEESVEAPAETRAGAREAAAAGQTPFPALKLVRASPNGAAASERASPPDAGEDHDGANAKIFALYRRLIGDPDDAMCDVLAEAVKLYTADEIDYAFREAEDRRAKNWPYIRRILERQRGERLAREKQAAVFNDVVQAQAEHWKMPERPREFTGDPEAARNWERTLIHLESVLGASTFDVYLRGTRLVDVQGDTYVVAARNEYTRNHLQAKLYRNVASALGNISGKRDRVAIEFVVQDELERA